jgi:hypothetical protein
MAIAQNFPIISPSLLLDFASVQALDPRITYARASTATYYGTRTALAEQNLLLQSQTFDNASWTKSDTTVTADTTTAPDGTTTAELLAETATTNRHEIRNATTVSVVAGSVSISVFVKKGTGATAPDWIQLSDTGMFGGRANFNISTGTAGLNSYTSSSIVSYANGWYRITATFTSAATTSGVFYICFTNNTDSATARPSYAGATTSDVFIWGAQLEQRSAVTAYNVTTTQPVSNYIPVLETAASGVARFDHNPTTFESLGLLVEQQSTNLLTYSDQFENAAWTKTNATITANTVVAPDGLVSADTMQCVALGSDCFVQAAGVASGVVYTSSCYFKYIDNAWVAFSNSGFFCYFNIQTGELGTVQNGSATITSVGNGWYRCTWTQTDTTQTAAFRIRMAGANGSATTTPANATVFIWGAQKEALALSTSYIQTVASQVTRAADAVSITGTNFSSWYAQGEGTLYVESLAKDASAANNKNLRLHDGTTSNELWLGSGSPGTSARCQIVLGGVTYFDSNMSNQATAGQFGKYAVAFETNNTVLCSNGTLGTLDTAVPISSAINQFTIIPPSQRAGYYKKIAYYPIRISNTQLQALTG